MNKKITNYRQEFHEEGDSTPTVSFKLPSAAELDEIFAALDKDDDYYFLDEEELDLEDWEEED